MVHQIKIVNDRFLQSSVRFFFDSQAPIFECFVLRSFCVPKADDVLYANEFYIQGSVLSATEFP